MYPDPETFNPDRWLSPAFPTTYREPLTQHPSLAGYSQFGFGRRVCQGVPVVEQDLFLAVGGMAWAFTARPRRDPATGAEVPVHWDAYTPLLIAKPEAFAFDAVPRGGEARARELRRMWEAAREEEEEEELVVGADGGLTRVVRGQHGARIEGGKCGKGPSGGTEGSESESDHDVLINVRESSSGSSDSE